MNWLLEPWTHGFMRDALAAGLAAGVACGVLGVFVVFRRMAFVGEAMSHTTLPGLVIAQAKGFNLIAGALASNLVTALGIAVLSSRTSRRRGIRDDAAIGVVFTGMFALGVVLTARIGSWRDLSHLLLGNLLSVAQGDLLFMVCAAVLVLAVVVALFKEMELASYDPTYADLIGIRSQRLHALLLVLIALAVVSGVQVVGVVLTSALLVTPAATAALLTRRMIPMLWISVVTATVAVVGGLLLSYHASLPSGATIVLMAALLFIAVWVWRRTQCG
jgi:manganese/iron transport system permease protein